MSNSIAGGLADLAARKLAARTTYAKAVAAQAAGRSFADGELEELTAALKLLNIPVATADADAALYAGFPALKAAVDALPTAEQSAAEKAKLLDELAAAEGEMAAAIRTQQNSAQMSTDLAELRVRANRFGHDGDRLQQRFWDAARQLAPVFAACPLPAPAQADDTPGPAKARKAAAAAR